ncbi:MAG: hypothetical protein IPJ88_07485 [Myxococcales bacterium]|nr:MAG: hypothetical protein IPJ88_07485 [Myxococcales bacterium]
MAQDDHGLYAGSSDGALLYRITARNKAEVLYDFPGDEVTALSVNAGHIAVAANHFKGKKIIPKAPAVSAKKPANATPEKKKVVSKPGEGQIWLVAEDGSALSNY